MIQSIVQVRPDRPETFGNADLILWISDMSPENSDAGETGASSKKLEAITGSQPRILIVDDNGAVRKAVSNLLFRAAGWQPCGEAASGAEAIDKARQLRPDVILLDIT